MNRNSVHSSCIAFRYGRKHRVLRKKGSTNCAEGNIYSCVLLHDDKIDFIYFMNRQGGRTVCDASVAETNVMHNNGKENQQRLEKLRGPRITLQSV